MMSDRDFAVERVAKLLSSIFEQYGVEVLKEIEELENRKEVDKTVD